MKSKPANQSTGYGRNPRVKVTGDKVGNPGKTTTHRTASGKSFKVQRRAARGK